jgi:hypothetical protein
MLAIGLLYIAFIMLQWIPSISSFFRIFIKFLQKFEFCQRVFLHLLRSWYFCPLSWLCAVFIDLHMLNHPCIPSMKPAWLWCMIFLMHQNLFNVVLKMILLICCWIWFVSIFWEFMHLCSPWKSVYNFLFLLLFCSYRFVLTVIYWLHKMSLVFLPFLFFME